MAKLITGDCESEPDCLDCPFCGAKAVEFNPHEICPSESTDTRRWMFKHRLGCWFNQSYHGCPSTGETLVYEHRLKNWNDRKREGQDENDEQIAVKQQVLWPMDLESQRKRCAAAAQGRQWVNDVGGSETK